MSDTEKSPPRDEINFFKKSSRTKPIPKNNIGLFTPEEHIIHEDLDESCLYKFEEPFLCIQYPGRVQNVTKAIETLGGIKAIEAAVDKGKLELCFHRPNPFSNGCVADLDHNLGLLVKIKRDKFTKEMSYEVIGASNMGFKFNRMYDFQYLPLTSKETPETKESEVEYVYDKIVIDNLPTMDWFIRKDSADNPLFLVSQSFARFDQPQSRFQVNSIELFNSIVRKDAPQLLDFGKKTSKPKVMVPTMKVSMHKQVTIPTEPAIEALNIVKTKFLQAQYKTLKKLFEERPVWTKAGIMHMANIHTETARHLLPTVAYYCRTGPWRMCWIKFGYDPVQDYNSRLYQTLDFRIRYVEGMKVRIKPKRCKNNIAADFPKRLQGFSPDITYVIRPNQIPPARQMFYQYCDILIPEVQEMLTKLPKLRSNTIYDHKNGWLPLSFQEHCREIVNRYVFEAVKKEVTESAGKDQQTTDKPGNVATYCSKMLSNIKKGVSESIGDYVQATENINIDEIRLSEDEEMDANEVVDHLPERLPDDFEDEDENDDSDLKIDVEALKEVNEIVRGVKDQKIV